MPGLIKALGDKDPKISRQAAAALGRIDDARAVELLISLRAEFERQERELIRPIGEKLNQAGGPALMRRVYQEVEAMTGRNCRSALRSNGTRSVTGGASLEPAHGPPIYRTRRVS